MGKQFPFRKLHVIPVLVVARIVFVLQIVGAFDIVVVIVLIFVIVRTVVDLHVDLHQVIDLVRFERHSVKKTLRWVCRCASSPRKTRGDIFALLPPEVPKADYGNWRQGVSSV